MVVCQPASENRVELGIALKKRAAKAVPAGTGQTQLALVIGGDNPLGCGQLRPFGKRRSPSVPVAASAARQRAPF